MRLKFEFQRAITRAPRVLSSSRWPSERFFSNSAAAEKAHRDWKKGRNNPSMGRDNYRLGRNDSSRSDYVDIHERWERKEREKQEKGRPPRTTRNQVRKKFVPARDYDIPSHEEPPDRSHIYLLRPPPRTPSTPPPSFSAVQLHHVPPTADAYEEANSIFRAEPPRKLYITPRFMDLKFNNRVPEICLMGASNAGKSHLLNNLLGLKTEKKRPAETQTAAHVHSAAGTTKNMEIYRVGSANWKAEPRVNSSKDAVVTPDDFNQMMSDPPSSGLQRQLDIIDMPGYGYGSSAEWGHEIIKTLQNRRMLKGAALLLPPRWAGKKGPERMLIDSDKAALRLLGQAGLPAVIVVTKTDCLGDGKFDSGKPETLDKRMEQIAQLITKEVAEFQEEERRAQEEGTSCYTDALPRGITHVHLDRDGERKDIPRKPMAGRRPPGPVWVPQIIFTSCKGLLPPQESPRQKRPRKVMGITDVRVAMMKLAGLMEAEWLPWEDRLPLASSAEGLSAEDSPSPEAAAAEPASKTVVPFDQIKWATTSTPVEIEQSAEKELVQQPGWPGMKAAKEGEPSPPSTDTLPVGKKGKKKKKAPAPFVAPTIPTSVTDNEGYLQYIREGQLSALVVPRKLKKLKAARAEAAAAALTKVEGEERANSEGRKSKRGGIQGSQELSDKQASEDGGGLTDLTPPSVGRRSLKSW